VTTEDDGFMGFEPIWVFVHHYVKRAWAAYHGWPNVSMEFGFKEIKIGSSFNARNHYWFNMYGYNRLNIRDISKYIFIINKNLIYFYYLYNIRLINLIFNL